MVRSRRSEETKFGSKDKLDALELIFRAPPWPKRAELSPNGAALFDAICEQGKPYTLSVVSGDFDQALQMASAWTPLVNGLIDGEKIADNPASAKMLAVYRYYVDMIADMSQLEKHSGG